jgi:hypothetical protein
MIYNLTHTEKGEPKLRLRIAGKISIGRPVGWQGLTAPKAVDHFLFLRPSNILTKQEVWTDDQELFKHYGQSCTSLPIIFVSDNIDDIFTAELQAWRKTGLFCHGNNRTAIRDGQEIPCPCDMLENRECRPCCKLSFMLIDYPVLGSIYQFTSTGRNTTSFLNSSLYSISNLSGGRLKGIPFVLRTGMKAAYPTVNMNGEMRKITKIVPVVWLEFIEAKKLGASIFVNLLQNAGAVKQIAYTEIDEAPELQTAEEMVNGFYPENQEEKKIEKSTEKPKKQKESQFNTTKKQEVIKSYEISQENLNIMVSLYENPLIKQEEKIYLKQLMDSKTIDRDPLEAIQNLMKKLDDRAKENLKNQKEKPPKPESRKTPSVFPLTPKQLAEIEKLLESEYLNSGEQIQLRLIHVSKEAKSDPARLIALFQETIDERAGKADENSNNPLNFE